MKKISVNEIMENPFDLGEKWALLTAQKPDGTVNTMTIAWGGFGVMWSKAVTFAVVRPQRFTREFIESSEYYTLSFFDEEYKKALGILGSKSGRDGDKIAESGLSFSKSENGVIFNEAKCNLVCKKLYKQKFEGECFVDVEDVKRWYPENDFHYMYVGEIVEGYTL